MPAIASVVVAPDSESFATLAVVPLLMVANAAGDGDRPGPGQRSAEGGRRTGEGQRAGGRRFTVPVALLVNEVEIRLVPIASVFSNSPLLTKDDDGDAPG